ncbi:MAG: hydrogenase 3 maturation endopeptidase HyCI [Candidatus Bathyarchaeota archaeon]|nr:hydrogenase 3 maturation endopeptidase HyCI [Candidatus Bathyarchaeota archaeon]MDW8040460.1 hydrogenase 3 maturation endopeptidase HyCI [Nitrososphaerota archaeon]
MAETSSAEKKLKGWLSGAERVVVAGVGNPIRMDDFVGVKVVRDLCGKVSENVLLVECETVPESFLQRIVDFQPSHVLIVDAAVMGLEPGEYRFVQSEHLRVFPAISTHMLPLRVFCDYLAGVMGAKVGLLLVEPKNVDFGEGLSEEVEAASRRIVNFLVEVLP